MTTGAESSSRLIIGKACPVELSRSLEAVHSSGNSISNAFVQRQNTVGTGGAGATLYLGECRASNLLCVIKKFDKSALTQLSAFQIIREVSIHADLVCPNIVPLYAAFECEKSISLVLEYCPLGDLYQEIHRRGGKGLPEQEAVSRIMQPVLTAMAYIHERNILHRDLKTENVLLCANTCKLADFGLSICVSDERPVTRLGTLEYMAPEVLRAKTKHSPHEHKERTDIAYNWQSDMWSIGILAHEVLLGDAPFKGTTAKEQLKIIRGSESALNPESIKKLSPLATDFLRRCLQLDAERRPPASALLQHPWITQRPLPSSIPKSQSLLNVSLLRSLADLSLLTTAPTMIAKSAVVREKSSHTLGMSQSVGTMDGALASSLQAGSQGDNPRIRVKSFWESLRRMTRGKASDEEARRQPAPGTTSTSGNLEAASVPSSLSSSSLPPIHGAVAGSDKSVHGSDRSNHGADRSNHGSERSVHGASRPSSMRDPIQVPSLLVGEGDGCMSPVLRTPDSSVRSGTAYYSPASPHGGLAVALKNNLHVSKPLDIPGTRKSSTVPSPLTMSNVMTHATPPPLVTPPLQAIHRRVDETGSMISSSLEGSMRGVRVMATSSSLFRRSPPGDSTGPASETGGSMHGAQMLSEVTVMRQSILGTPVVPPSPPAPMHPPLLLSPKHS